MFEETLYLRDDEADEFGDAGTFSDSLDEDYEEEEEEEEAEVPSISGDVEPEPMEAPAPAPTGGGGGGRSAPRKPAKKQAAKKAPK